MSGSITSSTGSTSASSSTSSGSVAAQTGTAALSSLSGNFSDFLSLLMTQLQNQDPSSPMDSEPVHQRTGAVLLGGAADQHQQRPDAADPAHPGQPGGAIRIDDRQAGNGDQHAAFIAGRHGHDQFQHHNAEPVGIAVYNGTGAQVQTATLTSTAGREHLDLERQNGNGRYNAGRRVYGYGHHARQQRATRIPFTVTGTATSVMNNAGTVQVQMGGLTLPFSAVNSVGN